MDWLTWGVVLKLSVLMLVAAICVGLAVSAWK
ncbi:membrane protein [Gordonia phage GourdThymes]|uniref:Uncharacterized protein n=10 Tax=Montyvirus TaxID=2733196 RepID=A0A2L1IVE0_9CAUD|nr:hypothetical protein BH763_gp086 [Gordonia phage Monty]YP_009300994.1 hypothetical protein BJD64_gp089 [Gordonia phage Hotorobo]YP_009795628.1 hypothetical protein HOS45_gp086 [Gordonia phage BirksAndSocks]YP_009797886.1 hypothetical protein HOS74_gp088 [Gordonia phage Flakey]YP_009824811.1 hypothetical protein HOS75_gp084 [Gordonia phage SteveFrench]YP_009837012.1 hypothetical protein HWB50_gp088 [Gordonia phage Adgers]YP_009848328.1 hypothetical protein HWC39_gp086 [Gordonia phage Beaver